MKRNRRLDTASLIIIERLDNILERLDENRPRTQNDPEPDSQATSSITAAESVPRITYTGTYNEQQDADETHSYLKIPPCQTSPDATLAWPIFGGKYPRDYINECLFINEVEDPGPRDHMGSSNEVSSRAVRSLIDEEAIPRLTEQFLMNVHIKNPILDVGVIREYARTVSQEGPRFDAPSCLVVSFRPNIHFPRE